MAKVKFWSRKRFSSVSKSAFLIFHFKNELVSRCWNAGERDYHNRSRKDKLRSDYFAVFTVYHHILMESYDSLFICENFKSQFSLLIIYFQMKNSKLEFRWSSALLSLIFILIKEIGIILSYFSEYSGFGPFPASHRSLSSRYFRFFELRFCGFDIQ